MHSTLNIRFILRLCCVVAILTAAVYGNGTSPNSTPVNVSHDLHNMEKAIKSLEATLEKNFQKLIQAVNAASGGGSGTKYIYLSFGLIPLFSPSCFSSLN